jgi:hypothetical protein
MSATMEISGVGAHDIRDTWTLVNDGSGQILHSFWCDGTASFVNSGELILDYSNNSIGGCTLVNTQTGTIRKIGGSTASIYHLVSDGFVVVEQGTLQPYLTSSFRHVAIQADATFDIWTGEHEIVVDGAMTGTGLLSIRGGTLTNRYAIDVETIRLHGPGGGNLTTEGVTRVGELLLENGSLLGAGEVYVKGKLTWTTGRDNSD